jgi:hypothetical protein
LKWPEFLLKNSVKQGQNQTVVESNSTPSSEQTFQLTGWRGVGWRMVFLEEPTK